MPLKYTKKYPKKYPARKFPSKTKKFMMGNPLAQNIPNSKRKMRIDFAFQIPILVEAKTVSAATPQLILPLNFPGLATVDNGSGSGTYGAIANPPDIYPAMFGTLSSGPLFDTYKVMRLVVNFVPVAILDTNPALLSQITPTSMFQFNDIDDSTLFTPGVTAVQHFLNNGSLPINWNITTSRPKEFVYRQRPENRQYYLNTQLVNPQHSPFPVVSTTSQTYGSGGFPNMFGSMKLLWQAETLAPNQTIIGVVTAKWECILCGIPSVL